MCPPPLSIDIYADRCHLQLNLPVFFEESTLVNIRKVFKLMTVEPWRNEVTHNKLQQFFPMWQKTLKTNIGKTEKNLKDAENALHEIRRKVGLFGTCATKEMKAEHSLKSRAYLKQQSKLKHVNADLERCGKIINAYNKILGIKGD